MTYYEELGLSARATEAEVKRSYKRLTLLLHPDQHRDPEIRALAEVQMKRLNEIVGILADAEQRRIYDKQLLGAALNVRQISPKVSLVWLRFNRGWILVSIAFLLFLVTALLIPKFDSARPVARAESHPQPTPAKLTAEQPVSVPTIQSPETTGSRIRVGRLGSPPLRRPSTGALASTARLEKPEPEEKLADAARLPQLTASAPALPAPPASLAAPTAPVDSKTTPETSTLAGKWVFTPDPMDLQDPNSFPAEYVELSILVSDGRLRGSYRSRYKLSNRALSPYANFTFDGPASGTSFVWRGDADAKGQITLQLQSRDTLQVSWFATKMGAELSLGSGRATVYRFR
jgi:curved DNA-binding protein CbpA